jgi:hypothetical protein
MPLGPEDITLTGKTLTGGVISASTLTGCLSTLATIGGSTLTVCNITGSTFAGNLASGSTITAAKLLGTSTLPIAQLTSSALLSTPVAGGIEYDGLCYYMTDGTARRQLVKTQQVAVLQAPYVLTQSSGYQKLLNASTNGAVNVGPNQTYLFECVFDVKGLPTTAGTIGWQLAGTATISTQGWMSIGCRILATSVPTAALVSYHSGPTTALYASSTVAQCNATIRGKVVVTTSGTLIPQIWLGHNGAAASTVSAGSYFRIWPVGSNVVNTVGGWT